MNRETWRSVKSMNWMQADKVLRGLYEPEIERARLYAYKNAFACVFTALHDRFPDLMTGQMLHSIGVDTIEYTNGIETPEELILKLNEETGFDIHQKVEDQPFDYIPKGAVE